MNRTPLHDKTLKQLTKAGWSPGRDVGDQVERWIAEIYVAPEDQDHVVATAPVLEALREFGGLKVRSTGPGISAFRKPFALEPPPDGLSSDAYAYLSQKAGSPVFPVGLTLDEPGWLAIDAAGRVLMIHAVGHFVVGVDIHDALNNMVLGVELRRLGES